MKNAVLRMFLICLTLAPAVRAQDLHPLLNILELQSAGEQAAKKCSFDEAIDNFKAAREAVKHSHSDNALVSGASGVTEGHIEEEITRLAEQQKEVAKQGREATYLLKEGKAESAFTNWQSHNGAACAPELGRRISEVRSQALEMASQGDLESNVRRRFELYHSAFLLDNQQPGLYKKMSAAHQEVDNLPCIGCRVAGRTIKTVLIVGGIGAAAYFGWHEYQIYEKKHSAGCVAGAACQ